LLLIGVLFSPTVDECCNLFDDLFITNIQSEVALDDSNELIRFDIFYEIANGLDLVWIPHITTVEDRFDAGLQVAHERILLYEND